MCYVELDYLAQLLQFACLLRISAHITLQCVPTLTVAAQTGRDTFRWLCCDRILATFFERVLVRDHVNDRLLFRSSDSVGFVAVNPVIDPGVMQSGATWRGERTER